MPVIGIPAFNAITILRIDAIDFSVQGGGAIVAHGAFVNTTNGNTYGKTSCQRWSKVTLDKIAELRAAMEEDLARLVFVQPQGTLPSLEQAEPGGIGEDLRGNGDAQQV